MKYSTVKQTKANLLKPPNSIYALVQFKPKEVSKRFQLHIKMTTVLCPSMIYHSTVSHTVNSLKGQCLEIFDLFFH